MAVYSYLMFGQLFGQKKQCFCDKNPLMNKATTSCETIILKNKSILYWQYNCNKIWLTLEGNKGNKVVINEVPIEFYAYTYRLGYQLIKEFENTILFRSGCPANGPCIYNLIDKATGKKIKQFGQLICIDSEDNNRKYQFDFVVYFSKNYDRLMIYYVNTKKTLSIPFDAKQNKLNTLIPEHEFDRMNLKGNNLTIFFTSENKKLKLNLKTQKLEY